MLKYIIVYFFIAALSSVHASHRRGGGGVPINFKDALSSFNHNSAHSLFDRQHFHVFDSKYLFGHGNFHSNISSECREKLESVFAGLGRREIWALQVADSFGKMPSGIYQDNLAWLGEFQECRNISVPFNSSFKFNYALLSKRLEMKDIVRPYSGIVIFVSYNISILYNTLLIQSRSNTASVLRSSAASKISTYSSIIVNYLTLKPILK